jgi:hypothetical protein
VRAIAMYTHALLSCCHPKTLTLAFVSLQSRVSSQQPFGKDLQVDQTELDHDLKYLDLQSHSVK